MIAFLTTAFPAIAGWITLAIGWWQKRQQAAENQNAAVQEALAEHANDGAQSALDQVSSDAQNAALDIKLKTIDLATPAAPAPAPKT